MNFNGIRRLYLPLRPKAMFSPGRKTPPSVSAPSTGLRPLNVSRVKCGERTLSRPISATMYETYDMPSMRLYERIAEDLILACRKHVVAATGPSPFKVGDNQRPERTGSGAPKTFAGVFRPRRKPDRGKEAESIAEGTWESAGA